MVAMKTPVQDTALFGTQPKARARRHDPATSFWAAQGIDVNRRQAMVLDALVYGKATQHEIIRRARELHGEHIAESTIRTGVSELENRFPPLVRCLGAIGKAPSGKAANVYERISR